MIKKIQKNQKGFTLVEVIVVAVIVAVLAAVAIPLYMSYISDSAKNTAINQAAATATFLNAARSGAGTSFGNGPAAGTYNTGTKWEYASEGGSGNVSYNIPAGCTITIGANTVTATVKGQTSNVISF
jgi:type IV pilus assembly protein PilA